ncbi:acyltransferase, partial [Methylobacterium tarhaniae]|uniref:acyltransferase n=1 Tax=Methylobacterium tarhaniae TaxID=1187852 RepID=UPI003CC9410F
TLKRGGIIYIGSGCTFVSAHILLEGDKRRVMIGDDCMFSWGIFARNYDSHCIFDIESRETINNPADLIIGSHVWVGQDALIAKGVEIGKGSIIGARSTVFSDAPSFVAVGGTPARIIRNNVSWCRQRFADRAVIDKTLVECLHLG